MAVKNRRYSMVSDFMKVYELCVRCYDKKWANGMCAPFFEYAQTFGCFDYEHSHRIGLWEDGGRLVALATYEIELGEAYFVIDPEYPCLAEEMIAYAERELKDSEGRLVLHLYSAQSSVSTAAEKLGYKKVHEYPAKVFDIDSKPMDYKLPEGFCFFDNKTQKIDYVKLDACLHYGFDHDDEPDGETDFRIHMHVTPHFDPALPVIVIDESDGEYAAYANAFFVPENKLAYLEPLCTQPKYRHRGLAAAVISEMIRRVAPLGADHITGGENDFYTAIGYKTLYNEEIWRK